METSLKDKIAHLRLSFCLGKDEQGQQIKVACLHTQNIYEKNDIKKEIHEIFHDSLM